MKRRYRHVYDLDACEAHMERAMDSERVSLRRSQRESREGGRHEGRATSDGGFKPFKRRRFGEDVRTARRQAEGGR